MIMTKYESARQKLERAKHHIRDLENLISSISRETHEIVYDRNSRPGQTVVKLVSKPLDCGVSMIFGDAVNNLRQSLDHAFADSIGAKNDIGGQVFFPIRSNREGLIASLGKASKKYPIPKPLRDLIVDEIKPYDGGHPTITALNKLANLDKHRAIITILGIAQIVVKNAVIGNSTINKFTVRGNVGNELNALVFPNNLKIDGDITPSLHILIGEAQIPIFHGKPAIPALLCVADDIAIIIGKIEHACP
jgi:hypothetical protein